MDKHLDILGILYIVFGGLGLLIGGSLFFLIIGPGLLSGDPTAMTILGIIGSMLTFFILSFSIPKIIAGIFLLKSGKMARVVNERVPGINVPDSVIREMEQAKDPVAKSIEIAVRTITELRALASGVHIMTLHWEDKVQIVLDSLEPWTPSALANSTD